jgi:hypothetical protein
MLIEKGNKTRIKVSKAQYQKYASVAQKLGIEPKEE